LLRKELIDPLVNFLFLNLLMILWGYSVGFEAIERHSASRWHGHSVRSVHQLMRTTSKAGR
jgi:hypothetical protein